MKERAYVIFQSCSKSVSIGVTLAAHALAALATVAMAADHGTSTSQTGKPGPAQSDLVIRQTTRRVLVDVVVTDEQGKPVRGLRKEDFSIKEDGKGQRILSFDVTDGDKPDFIPPKLPPLPANTFMNLPPEPERGPLYVIVYDMVNTELEDQATTYKPLLAFIDSKPEGTRFALYVNTEGLHMIQGFTSDKTLLHAALTSRGPGPHMPNQFLYARNYGINDASVTLGIFNYLATYLEGIQGRKNLIWMSGSLPIALSPDPSGSTQVDNEAVKEALDAMMRSQIAVYPVHVGGPPVARDQHWATDQLDATEMANYTGGKAFFNDNNVGDSLRDATEHGENFYTLSYAPSNEKYDFGARHIAVKLSNKKYQLTYRQLYYALPEGMDMSKGEADSPNGRFIANKQSDSLYSDIEHGAPMLHDLLFVAHVGTSGTPELATPEQMVEIQEEPAFFKTRRKNQKSKPMAPVKLQKYLIDYTVLDPQLKAFAERTGRPAALEFAAVAYDPEGRMLNGIANDAISTTPADAEGKPGFKFRVEQELEVPAGAAWVRLAVRDKITGHTGTLEVPLPLKAEPSLPVNSSGNRETGETSRLLAH